jgi:actin-like ATPase involved in cell morphogenesis
MGYRLGVDLGTTWTAAAVDDGSGPRALHLDDQRPALASVIARAGDDFVFGAAAEHQILLQPTSGVRGVKRRIGDSAPIIVDGVPYGPDALTGALLGHVLGIAAAEMGGPPDEVQLTHPASWGEFKLDVLRAAGKAAGLDSVALVSEPSAAARHYASQGKLERGDTVAVYDFGGGTFDAAVVRYGDGGFELLGTPDGVERLGGLDLDQAVLAHVGAALDGQLEELDRTQPDVRQALMVLRDECVRAKEALSEDTETTIPVTVPGLNTSVRLTRGEFEAMVRPRLADTVTALERAVTSAGIEMSAVKSVLLVGGSSRIPVVAEVVGSSTGRPTTLDAHPKLVVAEGAVAQPSAPSTASPGGGAGAPADDRDSREAALDAAAAGGVAAADGKPGARRGSVEGGGRGGGPGGGGGGGDGGDGGGGARRGSRFGGGAAVAAAVGVAAGAAAVADAALGGDSAGATVGGPPGAPQAHDAGSAHHEGGGLGAAAAAGAAGVAAAGRAVSGRDGDAHHDPGAHRADVAASAREHLTAAAPGHAAPAARGGGGGAGGRGGGGGQPVHEAQPAHDPTHDQFEDYRQDMLERLASWPGPQGASAAEVAHLREELVGVIHRAQDIPGQSLDDAKAELQDRLDDKLHLYQQDQQIEGLQHEEVREAQQQQVELQHDQHFGQFQHALAETIKDWQPAWWGDDAPHDQAALSDLQARVNALIVSSSVDPNKPLDVQEQALRGAVQGLMQTFQNEQYTEYKNAQDVEFDNKYTATLSLPPDQARMAQAKIINDRNTLDVQYADRIKSDQLGDSVLPTPPPTPEELQASAARIAAREDPHLDPSSGIDPAHVRTLGMTDAFDHVAAGAAMGDPLHQDPLHAGMTDPLHPQPDPLHQQQMPGEARADAFHDPTGGIDASQHLTTIARADDRDAMAREHLDPAMTTSHDPTGSMDAFGSHHPGDPQSFDALDPLHAPPLHHDPLADDPLHHDPLHQDPLHQDPLHADLQHADLQHTDTTVTDPAHAGAMPLDGGDPNAHQPIGIDVPQHDATDPFAGADPTAAPMEHDGPAFDAPVFDAPDDPAPAYATPDDDLP